MAGQVVRVKRETLEACMTCPLCKKLLKEATTISLCLHTFCRKCIYEKLSDEEVDCCPVCNIDLGCLPVEKLRPDHNLQDIRAKIFPLKRRKITAPEVSPLASLPIKRKERSLSSLVVNTPKVPMQSGGLTGRRSKNVARKGAALRGCSFGIEEPLKKEEDSGEDHSASSSSSDYLNKTVRHRRQDSSMAEPSNGLRHEDLENNVEAVEGKADLWTPLNCLVEAANRTKSTKPNFQGSSMAKLEPSFVADGDLDAQETKEKALLLGAPNYGLYMPKTRTKEHGSNFKAKDNHNNGTTSLPESTKRKRLRATARNKAAASGELGSQAQVVLDASAAKCRRNNPIWFTLIASDDSFRKGGFPLPQISTSYLRIKDGKMPVSSIQKYLVKKLDLKSEAEVEISCRGQPVLPTQQLQNLVDLWFRTASTAKKIPASVGSSAKDFVMVLSYCRKVQTP
ncbi:E3 ubiquitin protein ligase DRIP2-like isoform X1 [Cucurbita moschata]|uniref:E3 ubiquitin protein ligase DRIP2-like isoform X1 n=1 Tax=Cucurbita moschata TaxID=3662 RepID=A0A6J1G2X0_CUCMO|nr:E3 ubiquitin protein ligase DRIP2-like isoform X1 [Cucurbita moschata]